MTNQRRTLIFSKRFSRRAIIEVVSSMNASVQNYYENHPNFVCFKSIQKKSNSRYIEKS